MFSKPARKKSMFDDSSDEEETSSTSNGANAALSLEIKKWQEQEEKEDEISPYKKAKVVSFILIAIILKSLFLTFYL